MGDWEKLGPKSDTNIDVGRVANENVGKNIALEKVRERMDRVFESISSDAAKLIRNEVNNNSESFRVITDAVFEQITRKSDLKLALPRLLKNAVKDEKLRLAYIEFFLALDHQFSLESPSISSPEPIKTTPRKRAQDQKDLFRK